MHFFGHGRKIQNVTSASDASQNATWWQMYSLIEKETYHVRSWSDNLSTKCWKPWEHPLKHLLVRLERVSVKSSPNHIPQVKLSSSQIGPNRWRHSCYHLLTVISSGALLFSSRVLRPSLVTLCSHKSGRCAVELYHASHLWYPPFYTSPMASSVLQHWTLRRKAATDKLVEKIVKHDSWAIQPDIQEAVVAGLATSWHQKSMET